MDVLGVALRILGRRLEVRRHPEPEVIGRNRPYALQTVARRFHSSDSRGWISGDVLVAADGHHEEFVDNPTGLHWDEPVLGGIPHIVKVVATWRHPDRVQLRVIDWRLAQNVLHDWRWDHLDTEAGTTIREQRIAIIKQLPEELQEWLST